MNPGLMHKEAGADGTQTQTLLCYHMVISYTITVSQKES
jgi:hypothetical protein